MERILFGVEGVRILVDGVIIHAPTMPELVKRLWQVFKRCHQYNLKLNKSKCEFGVSKISILEHIVLANDNLNQQKRKLSKEHLHWKMSQIFDLFSRHVVTWLSLFQITPIL